MTGKIARNSNIELLRIIAMLLIVQSHFSVHGYMTAVDGDLSSIGNAINRFFITFLTTGNIGNGLFMIITGYFLSSSSSFSLRRFLRVVIQVLTYSLLCYIGYTVFFNNSCFTIGGFIEAATPLLHGTYWYFSSYILVYVLHPFINVIIHHTSQKQLGLLILIMTVVWGFFPSMLSLDFQKSNFLVFCLFYFIGAYIRCYYIVGEGFKSAYKVIRMDGYKVKRYLILMVLLWLIAGFASVWLTPFYRLVYMASPLIILISVLLFLQFFNLSIKSSRFINTIAACMGGVYLLSDNPYVRNVLYTYIFHVDDIIESNILIIDTVGYVCLVFVCCVIIEFIRKRLYDRLESYVIKSEREKNIYCQ